MTEVVAERSGWGLARAASRDGRNVFAPASAAQAAEAYSPHILIVDQDGARARNLARHVAPYGFLTLIASSIAEAEAALPKVSVDAVVVDAGFTGAGAYRLCQRLVLSGGPPVIIVADGADEDIDCIVALEMGAAHFTHWRRGERDLVARLRSTLTLRGLRFGSGEPRPAATPDRQAVGWAIDARRQEVRAPNGCWIALSPTLFELMTAFTARPFTVLSRTELAASVQMSDPDRSLRGVDSQVSRLRRRLLAKYPTEVIRSVNRRGYMFVGELG